MNKTADYVKVRDSEGMSTTDTESTYDSSDLMMPAASSIEKLSHYNLNRAENINVLAERGICWLHLPDEPWSLSFYLSPRGHDSLHIYLWVTKDLAWVQSWYYEGMIIGVMSVAWTSYLVLKAIKSRDVNELWPHVGEFLWLFANFWWMVGELHDSEFPNEEPIYDKHAREGGYIMLGAVAWVGLYYLILKPMGATRYRRGQDTTGDMTLRFSWYFNNWREYENSQTLFWTAKDSCWIWERKWIWVVLFIPTFLMSVDFAWLSLNHKRMLIDHAHYLAQLLWLLANAVWAAGEFFLTPNHDEAINMDRWNSEARITARWYSSWVVVVAYLPLVILYLIWIPATFMGKITPLETDTAISPHARQHLYPMHTSCHSRVPLETMMSPMNIQTYDSDDDSTSLDSTHIIHFRDSIDDVS